MDTKNAVLLMPLVSPRRPAKQPSNSRRWLFVCTLAGIAAGFSLGLFCGYLGSPEGTARTAHYLSAPAAHQLSAPLRQHAVIENFVSGPEPSSSATEAALLGNWEEAVAAVPAAAAAAVPIVGPYLPAVPVLELYQTPAAGYSHYHGKYFSQTGQDDLIDELLDMQQGGFFVESGAYNGVDLSNTLFLEATRGWSGLLVEAHPQLYAEIVHSSNRTNSAAINACVSPSAQPLVLPFKSAGPLSGLVQHMSEEHLQRIASEVQQEQDWVTHDTAGGEAGEVLQDMQVSCWPLHSLLEPLGQKTVDYWSLDTEGSEADILRATDFSKVHVRIITVEVNNAAAEAAVMGAMADKPYDLLIKLDFDLVFVKRGEFDAGKLQQIVDFNPSYQGYSAPGYGPRVANGLDENSNEAMQISEDNFGSGEEEWPEEWYEPQPVKQARPDSVGGYREWDGQSDSSSFMMQDEWDGLSEDAWQQ